MRLRRVGGALLVGAFGVSTGLACASFGAEDPPTLVEGGTSEAATDGGADAAPKCDPDSPFGAPAPYGILAGTETSYAGVWNTPAGVFVGAADGTGIDIRFGNRLPDGGLEKPSPVAITGEPFTDAVNPTLTSDGTTIFFSAFTASPGQIPGGGGPARSLFRARRPSIAALGFTGAKSLPTTEGVDVFSPSARGSTLLFAARDPNAVFDLYQAEVGNETTVEAHAVASLNGIASSESAAVLSADGLHVYFATSRATTATRGREDIWVATRKTPTSEWGDLRPLPELNSAGYDSPSWLSDDECTLLFVSNRRQANLATTFWDVYVAERTRR